MRLIQQWATRLSKDNSYCNSNCNSGNNGNQLQQWAVISAFFVLLGDFITFILAVLATQECSNTNTNNCPVQAQVDNLEKTIARKNQINQEIIKVLEEKINEFKNTM